MNWVRTPDVPNHPVGSTVVVGERLPVRNGYLLPYRLIGYFESDSNSMNIEPTTIESLARTRESLNAVPSLSSLGIVEEDLRSMTIVILLFEEKTTCRNACVCEMVCLSQNVPFRRDVISKVLQDQLRRNKGLSVEISEV